jgi:hypothetical protein
MPICADGFLTAAAKLEYNHHVQAELPQLKIAIGQVFCLLQVCRHLEAKLQLLDLVL